MSALHEVAFAGMPDGHAGRVHHVHEWGGPTVARAVCACGWTSPSYDEYLLARPENATADTVPGRPADAMAAMLDHLGYDPAAHARAVRELARRVADDGLGHADAFEIELGRHRQLAAAAAQDRPAAAPRR